MPVGNPWPTDPNTPKVHDALRFFEVSRPIFYAWRDSGMPMNPDQTYNLHDILLWRLKTRKMTSASETELKNEKITIQNARAMLDLREKQGELVSRREIKAKISELFHRIRTRLEAIPAEISTLAPTAQRAEFLADSKLKIRLLLKEMETWSEAAETVAEVAETADYEDAFDEAEEVAEDE